MFAKGSLWADTLVYDVTAFHVVQFTLHVVDVLIDLLHSLAVPGDLILVDLRDKTNPMSFCQMVD